MSARLPRSGAVRLTEPTTEARAQLATPATVSSMPAEPTLSDQDLPTTPELRQLYDSVGWAAYTRDPDTLARGLAGSLRAVTARIDGALVGLARVVGDGATICYLQDVLVDPAHQHAGIGRLLVEAVYAPFMGVRQHVLLTDSEPGQRAFYESLGFTEVHDFPTGLRAFARIQG